MIDRTSAGRRIPIEQLVALNHEIAALIRAGIPLELGLRQLAGSSRGALRRISERLADRMSAGHSLSEALDQEGDRIPGVYRAVVESGLRADRLSEALESLSELASVLLELHRRIVTALIYPLIVLCAAWGLLIATSVWVLPRHLELLQSLNLAETSGTRAIQWICETVWYWALALPVMLVLFAVASWFSASRRGVTSGGRALSSQVYRFAWYPPLLANYDRATFLRTFALLLRHNAPLHEALVLAAFSTGSRRIIDFAVPAAERIQAGESLAACVQHNTTLPSFLRWTLATGEHHHSLDATVDLAAEVYLRRAAQQTQRLTVVLPMVLTIVVGGAAAMSYGLLLFVPTSHLMEQLIESSQV